MAGPAALPDLTWFRTWPRRLYCAMRGFEWLGYVGTHCERIVLIEDIDDEQRVIDPESACPSCAEALAALEREP